MAGIGPPPKAQRSRARDTRALSVLPSEPLDRTPKFPLATPPKVAAEIAELRSRLRRLRAELDKPGRKVELRAKIAAAEQHLERRVAERNLTAKAERALWAELWTHPVAHLWVRTDAARAVASYVRWAVRADGGDLKAAAEARQLGDRLGLTPMSLMRLRVDVERADSAEQRSQRRRATPPPEPATDPRLWLVAEADDDDGPSERPSTEREPEPPADPFADDPRRLLAE